MSTTADGFVHQGGFQMYKIALTSLKEFKWDEKTCTDKKCIIQAHDEEQGLPWANILYDYKLCNLNDYSASLSLSFENESNMIYPAVPEIS